MLYLLLALSVMYTLWMYYISLLLLPPDGFVLCYIGLLVLTLWCFDDDVISPSPGKGRHRKLSCPICMEDTKAFTLRRSGKPAFFYSHRCFLGRSHAFRRSTTKFRKGKIELAPPPPRRNGEDIWSGVRDYPKIVDLDTI